MARSPGAPVVPENRARRADHLIPGATNEVMHRRPLVAPTGLHAVASISASLGAIALAFCAGSVSAQEIEGPLSPAGRLRIQVSPSIWIQETRFGRRIEDGRVVEEEEPLGFDLSRDRFGTDAVPGLQGLEEALRGALDRSGFQLSLGRTRSRVQASRVRVPIRLDLGVTDWLTVGGTIPFVRRRAEVAFSLRADTLTSNVGVSPAVSAPEATNAFLDRFGAALSVMDALRTDLCQQGAGSADCQEAERVLGEARSFRDALALAYGSGSLFPFEGSAPARTLLQRLGDLSEAFQSLGAGALPGSLPLAGEPLSMEAFREFTTEPEFGIEGTPLDTWQSGLEVGDVELHAAVRLLEGAPPPAEGPGTRPSHFLGVGALLRLGTGTPDSPENFVDLGTGDGQTDLELRAFGDMTFRSRYGIWADLRYGIQTEGDQIRRIAAPDAVLPPLSSRAPVTWDPGDYGSVEIAPRVHLTPQVAVAARYHFFSKGSDDFALAGAPDPEEGGVQLPDPGLLEQETEVTLHRVGISLVYSTLSAAERGETGFPFEAWIRYRTAVSGSGGQTPKAGRFESGGRLFWRLWER